LIRGVQAAAWNVGQKGKMDTIIHPSIPPPVQPCNKPYRTTVTDFVVEKLSPRIRTM
jgi:hypothetical protein